MPRAKRDYRAEYKKYHAQPSEIRKRTSRNRARAIMAKKLGAARIKGKHVDHIDHNPLNNDPSNLRLRDPRANMADNRHKKRKFKATRRKPVKPNMKARNGTAKRAAAKRDASYR